MYTTIQNPKILIYFSLLEDCTTVQETAFWQAWGVDLWDIK